MLGKLAYRTNDNTLWVCITEDGDEKWVQVALGEFIPIEEVEEE